MIAVLWIKAGGLLTYKLVGKVPTRPLHFPTIWPTIPPFASEISFKNLKCALLLGVRHPHIPWLQYPCESIPHQWKFHRSTEWRTAFKQKRTFKQWKFVYHINICTILKSNWYMLLSFGWIIDWLVVWLNNWMIDLLIDWLIDWMFGLINLMIDWLVDWLLCLLND